MDFLLTSSPAGLSFAGSQSDVSGDLLDEDVSDVEMDAILWSNLPDSLVDRIAASLPLPSLFRFRAVCKRFNSNMSQQSFLDTYEHVRKHAPHFLILVEGVGRMAGLTYSLVFHRWYNMPLPILDTLSKFDIVASSGGLLCLRNRESNALMVCNPLTCSVRTLPPLLRIREAFETGMAMDRNGKEYRIIVWRDDNLGPVTEVYTSKSNDWALKSNMQSRGDALSGVVCGEFFYVLVIYEEFLSVFAYEIEEDSWQELQASFPTDILYGYLINHWDTLLLVGAIGKNFPAKGISVWKLSPTRSAWIPMLSMPSALFESLTKNFHRYDAFNCAGQGDHICFVADRNSKALIYDFSRAAWHWSPHYRASNSQQQIVGVEFRFNAVP